MAVFGFAATMAATGRRAHRVAVEPFGDATGKGAGLGLIAWQASVELGNARPFIEEGPPVFAQSAVAARAQQSDHLCLVTRRKVQHGGRRRGVGIKRDDHSFHYARKTVTKMTSRRRDSAASGDASALAPS